MTPADEHHWVYTANGGEQSPGATRRPLSKEGSDGGRHHSAHKFSLTGRMFFVIVFAEGRHLNGLRLEYVRLQSNRYLWIGRAVTLFL